MLHELDSVVLRDEPSLRSRILSWFYPNRGWNGAPAPVESAALVGIDAAHSRSSRQEDATNPFAKPGRPGLGDRSIS
jgi:hypothetical protein